MQCVYIVKLSVLVRCGEVLGNGPVILTLRLQPISLNRPSAKSTRYLKAKMLQWISLMCNKYPDYLWKGIFVRCGQNPQMSKANPSTALCLLNAKLKCFLSSKLLMNMGTFDEMTMAISSNLLFIRRANDILPPLMKNTFRGCSYFT